MKKHTIWVVIALVAYFIGTSYPGAANWIKGKIGL